MRHRSVARIAACAVFAGVMLATVAAHAVPAPIVTQQVVSQLSPGNAGFSDVYGSRVVYEEADPDLDIVLFDSSTNTKTLVSTSTSSDRFPRIWGDYVVYSRSSRVELYRISKGTTKEIIPSAGYPYVDIYQDKVVYTRYSTVTRSTDVYVYDIDTAKSTKVVGTSEDEIVHAIWGDKIAYVVNGKQLMVYDLTTKKSSSLGVQGLSLGNSYSAADVRQNRIAVQNGKVAYVAGSAGVDQVFLYDLAAKTALQVSTDATPHANPVIYNDRVVYDAGATSNPSLWLYDVKAKATWDLGIDKAMNPSIFGDRIAWTDLRLGTAPTSEWGGWVNTDLYTGTLNSLRIAVPQSFTVSYGKPAAVTVTVSKPDGSAADTGTPIVIESSADGKTWSAITTTGTVGASVTTTTSPLTSKLYLRFWNAGHAATPGNPGQVPTLAAVVSVTPKVSIGTPVAPKTMKKSKYYTVYGSLKPRHTSGTKPVRIYKYRKVSGKWKSYGYVKATASNYSTYTRYKVKMRLTTKGSWRLRAYAPADSKHAATWSTKYDYVTVK